jgi:glutathione synthase/RimK-type ligase-like ATP-grasp enzyme
VILIIADAVDAHARLVQRRLTEKGARATIFDLGEIPERAGLSAWVTPGKPARSKVRREPETLDLADVKTIWFRKMTPLGPAENMAPEDQDFVRNESHSMLLSLGVLLEGRFWVNPVNAALTTDGGHGKIGHLEIARALGLDVPRTLATNDPEEARAFLAGCAEGAIYKPFRSPVRHTIDEKGERQPQAIFTNKLDERALAQLDGVRHAPCIFQELVPKKLELRVTAIGKKLFACELHSQGRDASAVDFRRDQGMTLTPHARHELPRAVGEKLLAVNERLGLVYGAFDLILTPEGHYVFLEVNQQGQFLWIEEEAGLPLLENFTEMLIQGHADYTCDALPHEPRRFPPLD